MDFAIFTRDTVHRDESAQLYCRSNRHHRSTTAVTTQILFFFALAAEPFGNQSGNRVGSSPRGPRRPAPASPSDRQRISAFSLPRRLDHVGDQFQVRFYRCRAMAADVRRSPHALCEAQAGPRSVSTGAATGLIHSRPTEEQFDPKASCPAAELEPFATFASNHGRNRPVDVVALRASWLVMVH